MKSLFIAQVRLVQFITLSSTLQCTQADKGQSIPFKKY